MKKLLATTSFAALMLSAASAQAQTAPNELPRWYGQVSGYDTVYQDSGARYNLPLPTRKVNGGTGQGGGLAVGYRVTPDIRLELETAIRHSQIELAYGAHGSINSWAGMGNVYADIPTRTAVTPYIGFGGGYAKVYDPNYSNTVPAFQAMTGVSYACTQQTSLILGYKYFGTTPAKFDLAPGLNVKVPYRTHNVELGLRYAFQ